MLVLSSHFVPLPGQAPESADNGTVRSFGNAAEELRASSSQAVCIEDSGFRCIRVTGDDRTRALHNLCTNDVEGLSPGEFCEVFFTSVKARILQNGYVSSHEGCHCIWLPGGDCESFLAHLRKYAFRTDVEYVPQESVVSVLIGPDSLRIVNSELGSTITASGLTGICTSWNENPVALFLAEEPPASSEPRSVAFSGRDLIEYWRIQEGLPVTGTDLTEDHLAPEAGRNELAISYRKGCYLGQEPIARIHAMGHVNRKLFRCELSAGGDEESLGTVTSVSDLQAGCRVGLVVLRVADAASPVTVALPCGGTAVARVRGASGE